GFAGVAASVVVVREGCERRGARRIYCGGVMEFGLGFGGESVGQKLFAEFDVKARVRAGIGAGKLLLSPTAHLRGHLAEGVFFVIPLDALCWSLRRRTARDNSATASGRCQRVEHHLGVGVVRA